MNKVKNIHDLEQSIWLDFFDREIMTNGKLQTLIDEDVLSGITSNLSIIVSYNFFNRLKFFFLQESLLLYCSCFIANSWKNNFPDSSQQLNISQFSQLELLLR